MGKRIVHVPRMLFSAAAWGPSMVVCAVRGWMEHLRCAKLLLPGSCGGPWQVAVHKVKGARNDGKGTVHGLLMFTTMSLRVNSIKLRIHGVHNKAKGKLSLVQQHTHEPHGNVSVHTREHGGARLLHASQVALLDSDWASFCHHVHGLCMLPIFSNLAKG